MLRNSKITSYGSHGLGQKAVALYLRMIASSIKPTSVTFVSVLSARSHSGLVPEHQSSMVDLLGQASELQKAIRIIHEIVAM